MDREQSMDAVEFIKQDHRRIEELFGKFLEKEEDMTQEDLYQEIQAVLNAHAEMEERVLYPAVKPFAKEQVEEAIAQHAEVKKLLAELLDTDLNEEEFEKQMTEVMDDVHEPDQEEQSPTGVLALARERLDETTLMRMADEIQRIQRDVEEDLA